MTEAYDNEGADFYESLDMKETSKKPSLKPKPANYRHASSPKVQIDMTETKGKSEPTRLGDHQSDLDFQNTSTKPNGKGRLVLFLICVVAILIIAVLVLVVLMFTNTHACDNSCGESEEEKPSTLHTTSPEVCPTTVACPEVVTCQTTQPNPVTCDPSGPDAAIGTYYNPATSCMEIKDEGFGDGVYHVKISDKVFQVHCDMAVADGGWMLVATINQNTLDADENFDDNWFLDSKTTNPALPELLSWTNNHTFGNIESCTTWDYKNRAFFEYKGSDAMIRHVPNYTPVDGSRENSFLQYQTENGFMSKYGGNIRGIFNKFPLNSQEYVYPEVETILYRLAASSYDITSLITDFYFYDYGNDVDQLHDGGNGMFESYGMEISVYLYQSCYSSPVYSYGYLRYGNTYTWPVANSITSSRKNYPFFSLTSIGNFDECFYNTYIRVYSQRPSTDSMITYTGNHTINQFILTYDARCRYGMTSPSICDVMFYVTNPQIWKSSGAPYVDTYYSSSTYYRIYLRSYDPLSNLVMGYTMLSRKNGVLIPESEISAAMYKILEIISETTVFCPDCLYDDVLSVPVQFSIGDHSTVDSMLPPSLKPLPTGFIQFRAYGSSGSVYAMCPAVSVNDWRAEYVCIGGAKNPDHPLKDDCKDFAHWSGNPGTIIEEYKPVDFAHSRRDLDSTIMIFYR